jgi:hypothetical protein
MTHNSAFAEKIRIGDVNAAGRPYAALWPKRKAETKVAA